MNVDGNAEQIMIEIDPFWHAKWNEMSQEELREYMDNLNLDGVMQNWDGDFGSIVRGL